MENTVKRRDGHFSDGMWADYVRGVTGPDDAAGMRAHLEAGCAECERTVELLGRAASLQGELAVPEALTAQAKAIFAPRRASHSWVDALEQLAGELVWEAAPAWQLQGVRSSGEAGLRRVYRAGEYSVDLQIDRQGEADEIVGQIVNESDDNEQLEGILVEVFSAGQTVGETATNRFGEFILDYPAVKHPVLRLALRHRGQRIEVPLTN